METCSRVERIQQGGGWRTGWARQQLVDCRGNPTSTFRQAPGKARELDRPQNPGFSTKDSKPLDMEKICGDFGGGTDTQPHRRVHWRDPQGPKTCTNPPTCKSATKGHKPLAGIEGSDRKWDEGRARGIVPSVTLCGNSTTTQQRGLPCPSEYLRLCPLQ